MTEIKRLGIVVPILLAFEEAIKAFNCIETKHIWTPYIGPQWEKNKAISNVWNEKSKKAFDDGCDYVIIMNDDAFVFPWCIDALVDEIQVSDALLVSAVNSHEPFGNQTQQPMERRHLDFSCFIITPELFEVVGLFDENFYPCYREDNDMHYRIQLANRDAYGIYNAHFYHPGSTTGKAMRRISEEPHKQFDECTDYYNRKWNGYPADEKYTVPFGDETKDIKYWPEPNWKING